MLTWISKAASATILLTVLTTTTANAQTTERVGRDCLAFGSGASYAINLHSTPNPVELAQFADALSTENCRLYVVQFQKEGAPWNRVRLGDFGDEATARAVLAESKQKYPQAWLAGVAGPHLVPAHTSGGPIIVLRSTKSPQIDADISGLRASTANRLYQGVTAKEGRTWYRVGMGDFPSEHSARNRLARLRPQFPGAWIDLSPAPGSWSVLPGITVAQVVGPSIDPLQEDPVVSSPGDSSQTSECQSDSSCTKPSVETLPDSPPIADEPGRLALYSVVVNRQDFGVTRVLYLADGRILVRAADLETWGLKPPLVEPVEYGGESYFDPSGLSGYQQTLDEAALRLTMEFAVDAFQSRVIGQRPPSSVPVPPSLGGFANYDLVGTHVKAPLEFRESRLDGIFELGVFGPWGVGTNDFLVQNLAQTGGDEDRPRQTIRLETTLRRDFPERRLTLELGDSIGKGGIWGRPVRFGGVNRS